MRAVRIVLGLWRNSAETRDRAKDPKLRTRYFKMTKKKMIEKVHYLINNKLPGWKVVHIDDERGEMLIEKKGVLRTHQMVISIFQIEHTRSAVDITASYKDPFGDLGMSYFTILHFYELLNKEIPSINK